MKDAFAKKRVPVKRGVDHGAAKLSEEQVQQMRSEYILKNVTRRQLAKKFGVSYSLVCMITRRQVWKHI